MCPLYVNTKACDMEKLANSSNYFSRSILLENEQKKANKMILFLCNILLSIMQKIHEESAVPEKLPH